MIFRSTIFDRSISMDDFLIVHFRSTIFRSMIDDADENTENEVSCHIGGSRYVFTKIYSGLTNLPASRGIDDPG